MKVFKLKGELRKDLGKKATKALRSEDLIPCVLYGGEENCHFVVSSKAVKGLVYTPNVYIVELNVEDKSYSAILKDLQFHPVSDNVIHLDFYQISADRPVVIDVPVKLNGFAVGVKAGGKLTLVNRKLKVKALPDNLPDNLELDVTNLELGKSIKVKDLSYDNIEVVNNKNLVIAQIKLTRAARAAAKAATGK